MVMQQERKEPLQQIAEAPPPEKARSRSKAILALLGVALPLIAGSMVWWPWGEGDIFDAEWVLRTAVLAAVVSVIVGACLNYLAFRAGWAALLALLAWMVGEFVGAVVRPLVEGGWTALQAEEHFWDGQLTILGIALWPLLFCLVVGALAGMGGETWMRQRASRRASQ